MANSVDPDQEQSDLGLHCLLMHFCPKLGIFKVVLTLSDKTSSSWTEWTGICCNRGFSSQNNSFRGSVFNWKYTI